MFVSAFDKPPDFVNEQGVKWWFDKDQTAYARKKLKNTEYAEAVVFFVEDTKGHRTRLLTCNNEIIKEDQSLEGMAFHIDVLKMAVTK